MYKCSWCNSVFDVPATVEVCCEDYYGVGSMFESRNFMSMEVCPDCGFDDFDDYEVDYEDYETDEE